MRADSHRAAEFQTLMAQFTDNWRDDFELSAQGGVILHAEKNSQIVEEFVYRHWRGDLVGLCHFVPLDLLFIRNWIAQEYSLISLKSSKIGTTKSLTIIKLHAIMVPVETALKRSQLVYGSQPCMQQKMCIDNIS